MKKFSTAVRLAPSLLLATSLLVLAPISASAQSGCAFRADAPDQHKVVKGDTLWDISGRFLTHPWCWPQVWGLNRDQIRDPHWIYPGQIVIFDRAAQRLRLGGGTDASGLPVVKLTPQTRIEPLGRQAIAAIPASAIEPFLTQPLIVEAGELAAAPMVVATDDERFNAAAGDRVYVRGDLNGKTDFQVFRPAQPLKDPVSGEILGYESAYLGVVRLDRAARADNEAHRFVVDSARQEIGQGARLIPVVERIPDNHVPHAPASAIDARIVSVYGGQTRAGRNDVVVINRGRQDGIDPGTVLNLYRLGRTIPDPQAAAGEPPIKLPDTNNGALFVFRVFDKLSYGLVMQVADVVAVNDIVRSPD